MRNTFNAKDPRSWLLRFHAQTAGMTLTAQQPEINTIRVAIQALAAVMGGNAIPAYQFDGRGPGCPIREGCHHRPTDAADHCGRVRRRQHGRPVGWFLLRRSIDQPVGRAGPPILPAHRGRRGVLPAIAQGFFQSEISDAAYTYQREIDEHIRIIVGVNEFQDKKPLTIPLVEMDPVGYARQVERLRKLREGRDNGRVGQSLDRLRLACQGTENSMPFILDCVRAYATLGEIINVMKSVFGKYTEPTWI